MVDRTDGDIDTLSNRIAQVRTWTFVANRPDWLDDPEHWQGVTRQVEDKLSDALHERLASRFVDRRTSVLMRRLRENAMLEAEITAAGDVTVEGQHVGHLHGFQFVPDPQAERRRGQGALRNAAAKALAGEIESRAERFSAAADSSPRPLERRHDPLDGRAGREARARRQDLRAAPAHPRRRAADRARPRQGRGAAEGLAQGVYRAARSAPLLQLEDSAELTGLARGIGFQIAEALGVLERSKVAEGGAQPRPGRARPPCAASACASAPTTSTCRRC